MRIWLLHEFFTPHPRPKHGVLLMYYNIFPLREEGSSCPHSSEVCWKTNRVHCLNYYYFYFSCLCLLICQWPWIWSREQPVHDWKVAGVNTWVDKKLPPKKKKNVSLNCDWLCQAANVSMHLIHFCWTSIVTVEPPSLMKMKIAGYGCQEKKLNNHKHKHNFHNFKLFQWLANVTKDYKFSAPTNHIENLSITI